MKKTEPVYLKEYDPNMGDDIVWIWINPPAEKARALNEAIDKVREMMRAVIDIGGMPRMDIVLGAFYDTLAPHYAEFWSQHEDPDTHWTEEAVKNLYRSNEKLWDWLTKKTAEMIKVRQIITIQHPKSDQSRLN